MFLTKNVFSICFSLFIFISCQDEKENYLDPSSVFVKKDTLRAIVLPNYIESRSIITPIYYSPNGLICCTNIDNKVVQLIDTVSGKKIDSKGRIGRGPEEMLSPMGMSYNLETNSLFLWDLYRKVLFRYSILDTIKQMGLYPIDLELFRFQSINDSTFVVLSFFPNQSIGIINNKGEYLDKLPYKVISDNNIDYEKHFFSSNINLSFDKKYLVATDLIFPKIALYTINDNKLSLKWEKMIFKPKYHIKNKWIKVEDNQLMGFNGRITNKYIYVSTQGLNIGELREGTKIKNMKYTYLLIFNLDGELVKSHVMDRLFEMFTITPDDKYLYAITDDPDLYVIKYALK